MVSADEVYEDIGIRNLLEAGLHFGHQTKRWNPKMKRFIFDKRNGIHIIDLAKSLAMLKEALKFLYDVAVAGKSVLFVGTKKQAEGVIKETALSCNQPYVTVRWLGGTLTNSETIRGSIKRMREIEELEKNGAFASMHKKEAKSFRHELEKLRRNLSGIAEMTELPGALLVIDINRESIAVAEANQLKIPVVAIVDTNCDPDPIDYPVPGNDDAIRAIRLIANVARDTILKAEDEYAKIAAGLARKKEAEKAEMEAKEAEKAPEVKKVQDKAAEKVKGKPAKKDTAGKKPDSGDAKSFRLMTPEKGKKEDTGKTKTKQPVKESKVSKKKIAKTSKEEKSFTEGRRAEKK